MIYKYIYFLCIIFFGGFASAYGQELLTKKEAVSIALENNFDIRTADNNVSIAENNADIKNSGYLPSLSANGSANYSITDSEFELQTGDVQSASGVNTSRYNASVGLNYSVFDGLGREYAFKKLKETYRLS